MNGLWGKSLSFVSEKLSASIFRITELSLRNSPGPNHKYHHLNNILHESLKVLVDIKKTNAGIELWLGKWKLCIDFLSSTF
jgi:hypothetical protein